MVAQKPVAATLRIRLAGNKSASPWNVLHHWKYSGTAPSEATLNSLCSAWSAAWGSHMAGVHYPDVVLTMVEAWDLSSTEGAYGSDPALSIAGTLAGGSSLPSSIAAVTSWKVSARWRGGHPRTYWPAGSTNSVEQGRFWTAAAMTAFETANNNYLAAINAITVGGLSGRLVCVRRWETQIRGEPPVELDPPRVLDITSLDVDRRIDTQRRRLGPDVAA